MLGPIHPRGVENAGTIGAPLLLGFGTFFPNL